jgi:hypothetical protein
MVSKTDKCSNSQTCLTKKIRLVGLSASSHRCFLLADAAPLLAHEKWFVSFYGGIYSDTSLIENLYFKSVIENSYISVISLGRELSVYEEKIAVEIEGQLGFHHGAQNHQEMNCAIILRWLSFPWDHYVDTSFAIGNGISYATVAPDIEIENAVNGNTNQWLYYMMVEWAFTALSQWEFFLAYPPPLWNLRPDGRRRCRL